MGTCTVNRRMRKIIKTATLGMLAVTFASLGARNSPANAADPQKTTGKKFLMFDNMAYKEKPDTSPDGLVASNAIYEKQIWPDRRSAGALPEHETFVKLVRGEAKNPGPLVIEIESLSLRGSAELARHNMEILAKLADWSHEAVPGRVVGFYGTNTLSDIPAANLPLAKELAKHVDAFFTALYTFDDDRTRWEIHALSAHDEARALDPEKPLYFYLWPQYHVGSARAMRYVGGEFWKFELETARKYGDGIVLWGSPTYVWDVKSGWWLVTEEFAKSVK